MNLTHLSRLASLLLIFSALASPAAATTARLYRVTTLEALPGETSSGGGSINDLGYVAGASGLSPALWNPQGSPTNLGIPATYIAAGGAAINNQNQIAISLSRDLGKPLESKTFRWTNGVYEDLGTLGGSLAAPYGIDEAGRITGISYTPSPSSIHAFRSTTGTALVDIDGLGGDYSLGYAINASGHVVGQALDANGVYHAFLWPGAGPMQKLDLGPYASTQMVADDISDNGIIIGLGANAFIWKNGSVSTFGDPNYPGSRGVAVNNAAQIVGQYVYNVDYSRPFVWDAVNGMADLNTLLEPVTGAGWTLLSVSDLNNGGQILGQGFHNGDLRAFVLTPVPEPASLGILLTALTLAAIRRRA